MEKPIQTFLKICWSIIYYKGQCLVLYYRCQKAWKVTSTIMILSWATKSKTCPWPKKFEHLSEIQQKITYHSKEGARTRSFPWSLEKASHAQGMCPSAKTLQTKKKKKKKRKVALWKQLRSKLHMQNGWYYEKPISREN